MKYQAKQCARAPKGAVTRRNISKGRRRATVIALTAVGMTTIMGFGSLVIDVGAMYNTKAELQRCADAAAMAAASELGDNSGDYLARARTVARQYTALNHVLNSPVLLDDSDFTFGQASVNSTTGKYIFQTTSAYPNAVRVRARRTEGSPSGPMSLFFARTFGINTTNISATAAAVLTPRDICFVLDLSLSHSFDSALIHYRLTDVGPAMKNVWKYMHSSSSVSNLASNGPNFGNMNAWGTNTVDSSWDFANDAGLKQLKRGTAWTLTSTWASQSLAAYRLTQSASFQSSNPAAYTSAEMTAINSATGAGTETSTSTSSQLASYRRRVLVGLGIYRWKSGKAGGQQGGNGDNVIDSNEVVTMVPYPSSSSNPYTSSKQFGGSWDELVDYVADTGKADNITSNTGLSYRFMKYDPSTTCYGNPQLRWRFGLKTMVDYIEMEHYTASDSPGFAGAPQQPMGAVADGVKTAITYIKNLNSNDQVGMVGYGGTGEGPSDYPANFSWLTTDFDSVIAKVNIFQSAIHTGNTNISQGIDKAAGGGPNNWLGVLSNGATNSRKSATKVIFLLTDGRPNIRRSGASDSSGSNINSVNDTYAAATDAAAPITGTGTKARNGCRIYTVAVGADGDTDVMAQVATIGKGQTFAAAGNTAAYQQQLQNIFLNLGGKRPVSLFE